MNLTDNDWGLIHDAITWELELLLCIKQAM